MAADDEDKPERTFTKAEFAREVARQVRAKVAEALSEYGDLDELRKRADEADKQQSKIDKMAEQLNTLTQRAEKAELDVARQRVADELGLTQREAKRLSGKTYDELKADAEELVEDLGIDVEARKAGRKPAAGRKTDQQDEDNDQQNGVGDNDDGDDDNDETEDQQESAPRPQPRRVRPQELRSGAPLSSGRREETDPLKLVAAVPRR